MNANMEPTVNLALALEGTAVPSTEEIRRLTGVAGMLETLPDPDIDPRFAARLEAVLMAEFDAKHPAPQHAPMLQLVKPEATPAPVAEPKAQPNVIALPRRRFVVRKAIAGLAAAAMISALPVVAAASSLPGSPFFGIEQFRQNHAISSARGAEKAFVMEATARKWIGYSAEMVALNYDANAISRVLRRAGILQRDAATLLTRFGSPEQIDRLVAMLAGDSGRLTRIRSLAPSHARPALSRAITVIESITSQLAAGLEPVVNVAAIITTDPTAAITAEPQSDVEAPKPTTRAPKGTPQVKEKNKPADLYWDDPEGCQVWFSTVFGDTLKHPSELLCRAGAMKEAAQGADLPDGDL